MDALDRFSLELLKLLAIYFAVVGLLNYILLSLLELELADSMLGVINFSLVVLIAIFIIHKNRS